MNARLALARPPRAHPFRVRVRRVVRDARRAREDNDLRLFALSFTAFFICFYTFIG